MSAFSNTYTVSVLTDQCGLCGKTENLQRCGKCKVLLYCSRDHQAGHRPAHKHACNAIFEAQKKLDTEKELLLNHNDPFMPKNVFSDGVGSFWGFFGTRDYMRARFGFFDALSKVNSHVSLKLQYDTLMDMLRICSGDNMGLRDIVPAVMLRLHIDQECYDFVKKWSISDGEPSMDIKNADVFEPVDYLDQSFVDLSQTVAMTLIKIRLLLDMTNLHHSPETPSTHLRSSILAKNKNDWSQRNETAHLRRVKAQVDLKQQIDKLYGVVEKANKFFWPALLDPGDLLDRLPGSYSRGSKEEMVISLAQSYKAWVETPGAMDVIRAKMQGVF